MDNAKLNVLLDEWYIAMRERQEEKAIKLKEKVDELYAKTAGTELEKRYDLMQIRYYLMMKDYNSVLGWFEELGSERDIPENLKYYYHHFNGILMKDNGKYLDALDSFLRAENFLKNLFNPGETAECKFRLAEVYFRLSDNPRSIKQALKSLELFQKEKNDRGCFLCENLLGLNSTVLSQYSDAQLHYYYAKKHAEKMDYKNFKCVIYLNFGDLFSDQGLPHSALIYLQKALEYIPEGGYDLCIRATYLLSKQYFETGNIDDACRMVDNGIKLVLAHKNEEYKHRFSLLKAKYQPGTIDVEQVYLNGLDYFKTNQLWGRVWQHSEELADYHRSHGRFTEATEFYNLAIQARKTIERKGVVQ